MAHILVCDDSKFQRNVIINTISSDKHTYVEATDGVEALEKLEENDFDLILLDLLMPNKDGMQVLEELQSANNTIPIIVLSADIQETTKQKCKELGVKLYINKPPNPSEVLEAIKNILRG